MNTSKKRINIVSLKMVKENSILYGNRTINAPKDAFELVKLMLGEEDREKVIVIALDTKNQPTNLEVCSIGTLNMSVLHPREVFKMAIMSNACSILLAHNHPSGIPTPSNEDIDITKRMDEAGKLMGINLIDHIIIGNNNFYSFKENNRL